MNVSTQKLAKLLGLVFASALMIAPSALAGNADSVQVYRVAHGRAPAIPFITEHSAGQNGNGQPAATNWGPLDPWAYSLVHRNATANGQPISSSSTTSVEATSFRWRDALIGAGTAVAVMLLAAGGVAVHRRRTHALTA